MKRPLQVQFSESEARQRDEATLVGAEPPAIGP